MLSFMEKEKMKPNILYTMLNFYLDSRDYFFHLTPNQTPPKVLNFVLSVLDNLSMIVLKSF